MHIDFMKITFLDANYEADSFRQSCKQTCSQSWYHSMPKFSYKFIKEQKKNEHQKSRTKGHEWNQ